MDRRKTRVRENGPRQRSAVAKKIESSPPKNRAGRSGRSSGRTELRKPGILALAAQVLADMEEDLNCEEILERIRKLSVKPSPATKISSVELGDAIKREITEKGEWSRFVHSDEAGKFATSSFGDELSVAAFCEARAKSRYIVMRERGETPQSIRAAAEVEEEQALIELCDDIIAGGRMEPKEPKPRPQKKMKKCDILRMLARMEEAEVSELRDRFLESISGQIFELAHEVQPPQGTGLEVARNVARLHRERNVG